jgi:very-short-patch-repair endonuclease
MMEHRTPSLPGSSRQDSPSLTGWGIAALQANQEKRMELHEELRRLHDIPDLEAYAVPMEARRAFYIAMGQWIESDLYGLWMEPDSGDGHNPVAMAKTIADRFAELANLYNGHQTQSPIEDMLLGALLWIQCNWAGFPRHDLGDGPRSDEHFARSEEMLTFTITPQATLSGCRVDFLLWFKIGRIVGGIAVECDGHAFHEKTKEQAARDKDRDRKVLLSGYPVMRFAGSEIFRDATACAEQVADALAPILDRVSREGGLIP